MQPPRQILKRPWIFPKEREGLPQRPGFYVVFYHHSSRSLFVLQSDSFPSLWLRFSRAGTLLPTKMRFSVDSSYTTDYQQDTFISVLRDKEKRYFDSGFLMKMPVKAPFFVCHLSVFIPSSQLFQVIKQPR